MRFSNVAMAYFVIGAVMFGAGVIDYDRSGLAQIMFTNSGDELNTNSTVASGIENIKGNTGLIGTLGGGLLLVWDLLILFIGAAFWPVTVLLSVGAPTRVTLLLGGTFVIAFIAAFIRLLRRSG